MKLNTTMKKPLLNSKAVGICFLGLTLASASLILNEVNSISLIPAAYADDDGGEGGKGAANKGNRDMGKHGSDRPTDPVPGKGQGQGGPDPSSDAKGPRYGGEGSVPDAGDRGGRPVWAQEGIPEGVELGRLNVARSPAHVLQRALDETLATWSDSWESLYEMTAEDAAELLSSDYDNVTRIDSPLANLAAYQDLLLDGATQLPNVDPASINDLAAILLGGAADKTVPISEATVEAVNLLLGVEATPEDITAIAIGAEAVRSAIEVGHEGE